MPLEIDHLFVCVSQGALETERVLALGMVEGSPNIHPGQGTANRRIFFRNAFLEFLWVDDEQEAQGEHAAPLKLWERWSLRDADACPFGVCLRGADPDGRPPFAAWEARPPYLPQGLAIQVATNAALVREPLLFCLPWAARPDRYPAGRAQPMEHPAGMREITGVSITLHDAAPSSDALRATERTGLVRLAYGAAPLMEVTFDDARQGGFADLRPALPLVLRW
jgi:hypothetical protein